MSLRINEALLLQLKKDDLIFTEENQKFRIIGLTEDIITLIACDDGDIHLKTMRIEKFLEQKWYYQNSVDVSGLHLLNN